jgi:hypothetical protein
MLLPPVNVLLVSKGTDHHSTGSKHRIDSRILNNRDFMIKNRNFKFYFMVGLPTETVDDIEGIVHLVSRMRRLKKGSQPRIKLSVATFVPKAHTPFQWVAQIARRSYSSNTEFSSEVCGA